jgi:tetratricopeptide (TPR) repeat protein
MGRQSAALAVVACLAAVWTLGAPAPVSGLPPLRHRFELRGQVLTPNERPLPPRAIVWVSLRGLTLAQTRAYGGKFKFSKLRPGSYVLGAYMPGAGEWQQTVEVSPSFADSKGCVEITVVLQQTEEVIRRKFTVSARELTIAPASVDDYWRAQKALSKRQPDKAMGYLQKAIDRSPAFSEAINMMGTVYYQQRDYRKAEEWFRRALVVDPQAYDPMINLGGTLINLGRYREALPFNIAGANRRPNDALANTQLGTNLFALGHFDNAIPYLQRAKRLDPAHFSHPQVMLAEIYLRRGDNAAALSELEEYIRLHPDDALAAQLREGLKKLKR